MPGRADLHSILIIGAGPIIIGQACEFDYSGAQACKALKEEGYRVILVNSNPATIMTDPEMADSIYIEPIEWKTVREIIRKEKPDALLPTMGGQTALNCALDLYREGVLEEYGVEMIGASEEAINMAEDRDRFRKAMAAIGLAMPGSAIAHSMEEAWQHQPVIGFPSIIRPSFTMGGSGGGIAYNKEEFEIICQRGLDASPTSELLIEQSVLGWKEYEMEVVRDRKDNGIIICCIENFDPMGIHTGDSITVAPAQTLTDKEYQRLRNASLAVLRKIGVDTGGSNVQFAVNPDDGELLIIEMNPRVSRSSALASKATGFPIARVAAKLAVGWTLDELSNDITDGKTPASFEPAIDYVVTKIPRFTFEKFPQADDRLTTQMKSVGEVMAIGRTFQESLQKALRSMEIGIHGLDEIIDPDDETALQSLGREMREPGGDRLRYIADAFRSGQSLDQIFQQTQIDPWFLVQIEDLVKREKALQGKALSDLDKKQLYQLKRRGFSDCRLAHLLGCHESDVRKWRFEHDIHPVYKRVDSCAGEFASSTAYMYSTYEEACESQPTDKQKIMVLGGGPNRIGQGIEFDYCCVHAALASREDGYETIMVNCNPETVSTDYDISDRLYFEPLTLEDVLEVLYVERPQGVIVQYGGQTPLKLAHDLEAAGAPIIGTSPDSIDLAEDRERFQHMLHELGLKQPLNRTAVGADHAVEMAQELEYPLVVRPSYVLGGRAMEIVHNAEELKRYMAEAIEVSNDLPVLLDQFLDHAVEVDVDAVCDTQEVIIAGIMEHIEQAGIHSGDSACSLPPYSLDTGVIRKIEEQTRCMAMALHVKGLMNVQFAVQGEEVYVLEINPRASRTVPFVSKAQGIAFAKVAARCMTGQSLQQQGIREPSDFKCYFVKEAVFPFIKFPGVDPILSPEMKSTGEVMGVHRDFGAAYARSQLAAGNLMPSVGGTAFISVRDSDKAGAVEISHELTALGFSLVATCGTAQVLNEAGLTCEAVNKVQEGRPHVVDMIKNNQISFILNTTEGTQAIADSFDIRRQALQHKVYYTTTLTGGRVACMALRHTEDGTVTRLQDIHQGLHHG